MIVFFDIDGTIVDEETEIIPQSTALAIRLLRQNGHLTVVNTGRSYTHVDQRIRDLGFDGFICACGSEVILNGEYLYQDYPTAEECAYVYQQAAKHNMQVQAETVGGLYYDETCAYSPKPLLEAQRLREKGIWVKPYQGAQDSTFVKFVTYDTEESDREGFLKAMAPIFDPMCHRYTMIEFNKRGNTKANGMERLLHILGMPKEETFAIGDAENDLPMFAVAGTTICMGSGMEKAKAAATYITDAVLEDGIFNALRHFGLI